jgi:hypothetical protein
MSNKLLQDRSGNISSKRFLIIITGVTLVLLGACAGFGYLYFLFFEDQKKDLAGVLAILGILGGFVTTLSGISLGEKKDK